MIERRPKGYTLMEVLIAVTLLAVVLTVVLGTQANHVQLGATANEMGTATLLGRAKMLEIESELLADGFVENTTEDDGDFREQGFAGFKWESEVEVVEINDQAQEALLGEANGKLFGEGEDGSGGTFTGNSAFASYLPMVVGMLPEFINRLGERARKVTLTIRWQSTRGERTLTLVQYVTSLDADDEEGGAGPATPDDPSGAIPGGSPTGGPL